MLSLVFLLAAPTGHGSTVHIEHDVAAWICKVTQECTLLCRSVADKYATTSHSFSEPTACQATDSLGTHPFALLVHANACRASGLASLWLAFCQGFGFHILVTAAQLTALPYRSFRDKHATNSPAARDLGLHFGSAAQLTALRYRAFRDKQATNSHCLSTPTSACEATR